MIFTYSATRQPPLRAAITSAYRMDETKCINNLLNQIHFSSAALDHIAKQAEELVIGTRDNLKKQSSLASFLHQYDLSSEEGIALMCLAEALLRIPDTETIDRLISDKLSSAEWKKHLESNNSFFVNAATWSLMLTGKIFSPNLDTEKSLGNSLKRLGSRLGGGMIRPIVMQGMKLLGNHFVLGQTIEDALEQAKKTEEAGYCYSYDMLGEAARTAEDAENYFRAYQQAITAIGNDSQKLDSIHGPGISIKLSALHPRYEFSKREKVLNELIPRLLALATLAKQQNIGLTVDAEEADRLDLSLDIIEAVFNDPSLQGWEGFGLAVQAYQKRASFVIDWLAELSTHQGRRFMVRLVKGAYWDSEIKQSQVLGLEGYPVFTRKNSTDVSYLACAQKLLSRPECFYPQFGTHNAHTVAAILEMVTKQQDFEFQCLHGMGDSLYDQIIQKNISCRVYAPVGSHKDLLGYLVRRLLENGANTSFINQLADEKTPVQQLIEDPIIRISQLEHKPHPYIPLPKDIYGNRINSQGLDLSNVTTLNALKTAVEEIAQQTWQSSPLINGKSILQAQPKTVISPIDHQKTIGTVYEATKEDVDNALVHAIDAQKQWATTAIEERALCLEQAANLFENNMPTLITLLCQEGGKQIIDCISEVRETVDYCRYYAERARKDLIPQILQGPTGELNELSLHPRGTFACISPWNFPLAIFTGQIVAALVCGNTVIAKPAEQTPLIAAYAIHLLHQAGIPNNVLQLLPGQGDIVGSALVADPRIVGVMFTGSTETAKSIQRSLADRLGSIIPFIAETGGQNAMIVDSSALPEQVVADVLTSAFDSAGQRCSALRVLFIQEEIADHLISMLKGAMAELTIGDPSLISIDAGPVIDNDALQMLQNHFAKMSKEAKLIYQVPVPNKLSGNYFAPCAFELNDLGLLKREVFGPILHVIRYEAKDLDKVLESIINTGYGLTMGIHSRINATINYISERMPIGNIYVNRNMIGAVVGVQPFGGERLSGTGPKAGGPHYLPRLCVERSISINTTAAGGNATLVTLAE